MSVPSNLEMRGRWRRRLFWAWIVVIAVLATYIGIAGPVTGIVGEGRTFVALAVPAVMFFMLSTGLTWLVSLVVRGRAGLSEVATAGSMPNCKSQTIGR